MIKIINKCQICDGKLTKTFSLGKQPLCDDLIKIGSKKKNSLYYINIIFCKKCIIAYNQIVIDPRKLFPKNYHYRSNLTKDVLVGMKDLVDDTKNKYGKLYGKIILDIGCNDGSLLNYFKMKGAKTIGVEPTSAALIASKNHEVYNNYFSKKVALDIKKKNKSIDYITFTNVFAHIADLKLLINNLKLLINIKTKIIIENHYLGSVIKKKQFDTFYHEHPRTYSLYSFIKIAKMLDMHIENYSFKKRYGGNIRVIIGNNNKKLSYNNIVLNEKKFFKKLLGFKKFIIKWKKSTLKIIKGLKKKHIIVGKAFPGRAAVIINILNLNLSHIREIYEKPTSPKIGHYVPNTRIPIVSDNKLSNLKKKIIIINFAWHIKKEIRSYLNNKGLKNKILDIL
jgi:SAM-dependent methyltransferase